VSKQSSGKKDIIRNLSASDKERVIQALAQYLYEKEQKKKRFEKLTKL